MSFTAMAAFREASEARGAEVVESITAFAQPGGPTALDVYQQLRDTIIGDLRDAGDVDVVLLSLHGAMIAETCDDCEGDLLRRIRNILPRTVIGAELDPHCHLSTAMLENADVLIAYKEYPHTDIEQRALDLARICFSVQEGAARPVCVVVDLKMVGAFPTGTGIMAEIVTLLYQHEQLPNILSVSFIHGFPWGDVADSGARVLVIANDAPNAAAASALAIADRLYCERDALASDLPDISTSLDRATLLPGCTVLADNGDNPGGGAPGDATFFLREIIARDLDRIAIGCFHDPSAVQAAAAAGSGSFLTLLLGGKAGPASGDPVTLKVKVMAVVPGHSQGALGDRQFMGLSAWLRFRDIDIIVSEIRAQVFDPDIFTGLGIDLSSKRLIVVKSSSHFEAAFKCLADRTWRVDTPGTLTLDFANLVYRKRSLNYHPRVADPLAIAGGVTVELYRSCRRIEGLTL